jgi:ribonuclease Z
VLPKVKTLVNIFADQSWLEMLPITFHEILPQVGACVAENEDFVITAAPTCHSIDSIALKFHLKDTTRNFVYSSDTRPCNAVEHLATDATLLFHEATDSDKGHTRPAAAGALAARSGAERLTLIHYYTQPDAMAYALEQARTTFAGPVELAKAFVRYPW